MVDHLTNRLRPISVKARTKGWVKWAKRGKKKEKEQTWWDTPLGFYLLDAHVRGLTLLEEYDRLPKKGKRALFKALWRKSCDGSIGG